MDELHGVGVQDSQQCGNAYSIPLVQGLYGSGKDKVALGTVRVLEMKTRA